MKIKDIWGESWPVYRGMTVRWVDDKHEYAGMITGVVTRVDDKSVSVLAVGGDYYDVDPEDLIASNDNRSVKLRELDPVIAAENANEYADAWEAKYYMVDDEQNDIVQVNRKGRNTSIGRSQDIMKFIESSEYRVNKRDIMANVHNLTDSEYTHAMRNLLSAKRIKQEGKRKAATYGLPGRVYNSAPIKQNTTSTVDVSKIVEFIKNNNNPVSRSDLREVFGFSDAEWVEISNSLKAHKNVEITGKKRGTRYLHKV